MRAASWKKAYSSHHSQRLSHDHYVHEPLVAVSRRHPDAIAAIAFDAEGFDRKSISYGKLASRARNLAARLVPHLGNRPGASVGVLLNRGVDCLVAAAACSMAGAAYVPMDEKYPRERLEYIAKDAQCAALIVADGAEGRQLVAELLPLFSNPVVVTSAGDDSPASAEALLNAPRMAPAQAPAYIMYTSGSTGLPKGVMMSHRSLNAYLSAFLREVGMPSRGVLMSTPSGFDINLFEIWGALLSGTTALVPTHIEIDENWFRSTAKAMNRHGCSFVHGVPAVLHGLFAAGWSAGSDASVVSCGEVFPVPLANALRRRVGRLFNGYGPTETHYCTTYRVPSSSSVALGRSVPIGKPLASATVHVERTDGSACKVGEDGELMVSGDTVALGYLNRPVETHERFFERNGQRVYRTGDIVRLMPDGNLDYVGRRDQQLNAGGLRVEAAECERPLVEHPLVQEAVVVETGGVLRAYVTLRRRGGIDAGSLARWLVPRLPFYHIPRSWEFLEQLPRTSTQKIDRKALMMRDVSKTTTVSEEELRRDR